MAAPNTNHATDASGAIDSARARGAAVFRHHEGERAESRLLAIEARPRIIKELIRIALEDRSGKLRVMAGQVVLAVAERVTPLAVAVAQAGAVGSALPPGAQLVAGERVETRRDGTPSATTTQVGILAPDFRF